MQYTDEMDMQKFKKIDTSSWESLKNDVYIRLINKKSLSKYGEDIAYAPFMDLALTFSVQEKSKDTMLSYMLTNKDLENFHVDINEARKVALDNTSNDRKKRIMTFKESTLKNNVMYPIMQIPKGAMLGAGGSSINDCGIIQDTDDETDMDNVLILCNKHDVFGSSYMACTSVLDEVYKRFDENFYIIPMSTHHVMCIRDGYVSHDGEKPRYEIEDDLLDMIEAFNDNHNKSWKNILSYKIYYYYGDDGKKLLLIQ